MEEMPENQYYEQLRNAVEGTIGKKPTSTRDFEALSKAVFEKAHKSISTSTLKRFWGYLPQYASIRTSTLDILSQFVGYKDWNVFCQQKSATKQPTPDPSPGEGRWLLFKRKSTAKVSKPLPWGGVGVGFLLLSLTVLLLLGVFKGNSDDNPTSDQPHILRQGQTFDTCADYLRLFGITSTEHSWDQPLPHHEGIVVWGPEYHHQEWHNDGDSAAMMPTITEWWTPADSLDEAKRQELTAERNGHLYFTVMRTNELRITFMKNLTDTGYVFLGIYRTDLQQSDSTHIVWERIADECDLANLSYLQQLRH